jgi:uncharacterized membrane protein YebE (DUF533 family)
MDPGFLVNGVLRSVMGGRGKTSRKALRYLTRGQSSLLSHPAALLAAAGVAWGIYETLQGRDSHGSRGSMGSVDPATAAVPPLPDVGGGSPGNDAMRLVRLAISAAHADGTMNEHERAAVLQQAIDAGVGDVVEQEIQRRTPLAEIVSGVADAGERATLYVLAFTILRADEQITGAERIYLAQLAHLLGLDPNTVQQLEKDAGERIDALGDQGQLGG